MDFAELDDEAKQHLESHQLGKFKGFKLTSNDDSTHWEQYWMVDNNLLLFATYNCELEDKGTESESVSRMLNTIEKNNRTNQLRLS